MRRKRGYCYQCPECGCYYDSFDGACDCQKERRPAKEHPNVKKNEAAIKRALMEFDYS